MTSVMPHIKMIPSENSYFINVGALGNKIYNYDPVNRTVGNAFSTATWANSGNTGTAAGGGNAISTVLGTPGSAILRDLGKTVVSSLRTFRKVQLVHSSITNGSSTGAPVSNQLGNAATTSVLGEEYFTGYIEVMGAAGITQANFNSIAPVARLG